MNFHGGDIYRYNKELVDFSSNINPLGVPDSFRRLLLERLEDFTRYPDMEYLQVKEKIAEYLQVGDTGLIIPGNGAIELIYKLAAVSGARQVASLRPTFSEYARAAEAAGLEFVDIAAFNADYSGIDMDMLLSGIKPRSLVIICNPNNPTGTLIKKKTMRDIAAALLELDCRLVIDEAFIEFTEDYPQNSMVDAVEEYSNLTVIRAATKFFGMPGIRLGYAVTADTATAKAVNDHMEPWNLNSAAVIAACSIFQDHAYIERSKAWIKSERGYLHEELGKLKELKVYPSEANFHLAEIIGGRMTAAQLKSDMVQRGILIRTAEGFKGLSEFHFRVAVKDRSSNELLIKALQLLT